MNIHKAQKQIILDIIKTLYDAHKTIVKYIRENKTENACAMLADCQNSAVEIGISLDKTIGENSDQVCLLEEYCEALYNAIGRFGDGTSDLCMFLDKTLYAAEDSINQLKCRPEIVFLPYQASMWDSMESVWRAAAADLDCDVYVVPIPYYDRNADFSFGSRHYDGNLFPSDVPITDYSNFDLEDRRPDIIYIHNPYDEVNLATSVDPRYYSSELKKHTDMLVLLPYFIPFSYMTSSAIMRSRGIMFSDRVVVMDEDFEKKYDEIMRNDSDNEHVKSNKEKFLPLGSPKFDKVMQKENNARIIPPEWRMLIYRYDGTKKTVILYNTSIADLLSHPNAIEKIASVLEYFARRNDVVIWWRPHPLYITTLNSMRTELLERYQLLVEHYKRSGFGIFDETKDLNTAISYADAYYGDISSLVALCKAAKIPVATQNYMLTDYSVGKRRLYIAASCVSGDFLWLTDAYDNGIYRCCLKTGKTELAGVFPDTNVVTEYVSYSALPYNGRIVFVPCNARGVVIFDTLDNSVVQIPIKNIKADAFGFGYIVESTLYMMPRSYPDIVAVNLADYSVKYIDTSQMRGKMSDNFYWGYGSCMAAGKIYLNYPVENKVLCFDVETLTISALVIGDENCTLGGLAYYDGCLYFNTITPSSRIIKYSLADNKCSYATSRLNCTAPLTMLFVNNGVITCTGFHDGTEMKLRLGGKPDFFNRKNDMRVMPATCFKYYFTYDDKQLYADTFSGCVHNAEDNSVIFPIETEHRKYGDFAGDTILCIDDMKEMPERDLTDIIEIAKQSAASGISFAYNGYDFKPCGETIHNEIKRQVLKGQG